MKLRRLWHTRHGTVQWSKPNLATPVVDLCQADCISRGRTFRKFLRLKKLHSIKIVDLPWLIWEISAASLFNIILLIWQHLHIYKWKLMVNFLMSMRLLFFTAYLFRSLYSYISYRKLFPSCCRCDPPKIPSDENFPGKYCIPYSRTAPRP